ncbi:MAG: YciI family protein [Flavobacteriales bacterium]
MSKYIFLFRGGMDPQKASPEQMQANMLKWKVWMDTLTAQGTMLGGEPLDKPGKVLAGRGKKITDGPFAEGKEIIGGYLVVNAASLDAAVEIGKSCPIFENDGSVEVRTVLEMNM